MHTATGPFFTRRMQAVLGILIGLLILDVALALWAIHWTWFSSTGFVEYFGIVVDFVTQWTGRLVWIFGVLWGLKRAISMAKPADPGKEKERTYAMVVRILKRLLAKRAVSASAMVVLAGVAGVLSLQLLQQHPYVPVSSQIVATPYVRPLWPPFMPKSNPNKVYLADHASARIDVFATDYVERPGDPLRFGNPRDPVKPSHVAYAPRRGELLITVPAQNQLLISDVRPGYKVATIQVGQGPTSIAITPDERKAYVSNELPARNGTISVIDLAERKVVETIRKVNCPEGMSLTPDGRYLYVASQCGAGYDPLFVIDTRADKVVASIAGMAVGSNVLISRDGRKAYVKRSGFDTRDAEGKIVRTLDQLTVVDTGTHKAVKNIPCAAGIGPIGLTTDGKHLFLGSDKRLVIFDVATDEVINTILLDGSPGAIATTEDGAAFVWIPERRRIFVQGLDGIQKKMQDANLTGCKKTS